MDLTHLQEIVGRVLSGNAIDVMTCAFNISEIPARKISGTRNYTVFVVEIRENSV